MKFAAAFVTNHDTNAKKLAVVRSKKVIGEILVLFTYERKSAYEKEKTIL